MKNLGTSPKEKFSSPRRPEDRGSSFHEVLSSGSSSKGTGSSVPSNISLSIENDDGASSSDVGASSDFSNGHCKGNHASTSQIADEEDEDGDGIISLGKMKWFFELNEKEAGEVKKSARDIPIIIEDVSSDDDRDIRDMITDASKKKRDSVD